METAKDHHFFSSKTAEISVISRIINFYKKRLTDLLATFFRIFLCKKF